MKNSISKSSLFKLAWNLFKAEIFTSFSDALRCAWLQSKNVANLRSGEGSFVFRKVTGGERVAVGTLSGSLINYEQKGTNKPAPINIQRYYDLEKQAYRSYRIENLLSISA